MPQSKLSAGEQSKDVANHTADSVSKAVDAHQGGSNKDKAA
ncbi:hypothetical protein [Photobacterium ganghwense]